MSTIASFSPAGFTCRNPRGNGKGSSVDRLLEGLDFRITRKSLLIVRRSGMSFSRLFREFVDRRSSSRGDFASTGGSISCINAAAAL